MTSEPAFQPSFRWPDGRRAAISITFDDARSSQVERGLPILDAHGVKGTFYVSFGRLEQHLDGGQHSPAGTKSATTPPAIPAAATLAFRVAMPWRTIPWSAWRKS